MTSRVNFGRLVSTEWAGRRVLLTGHTGFKGSWMALWLAEMGAVVRGYALEPPSEPNLFTVARVANRIEDQRADVLDLPQLQATMAAFQPEIVFHMAAQPLVRRSYADPVNTYATNVMGTVHLLEAVRHCSSVRAVVCITTDKCYENREWHWGYREQDRLGGLDPYSNSKACAELVASAFRESYFPPGGIGEHGVAVATVRAGNVIGGGDWAADRLIPDLVRGFLTGQPVAIRNPHAVRPWQHVLDPLYGYLLLGARLLAGEPAFATAWNFGPAGEDARPVEWIAQRMAEGWGSRAGVEPVWTIDDRPHRHEASYLRLDCARARALLGWQPALGLAEALSEILNWFEHWQAGMDMQRFTCSQIAGYQARAAAKGSSD